MNIRSSVINDAAAIMAIYQQPSCYAATLQLPYPSLDKWQAFLGADNPHFYSLVAEVDGKIVGQIGMDVMTNPRRKHVANIGMAVDQQWQGKGVGKALLDSMLVLATKWLAIKRIELEVYTENNVATALYKKSGFAIEGTAKGYAFRDGEYADVYLMAKVLL
jgi:putative acetyltransferase